MRQWARDNRDGFAAAYQQARAMQVEAFTDEIVLIANRADLDPNDKRVRIDTQKWLCSKLVSRKYGDRLLMAGDPDSPIQHMHKQVSLADLSYNQLQALDRFTIALMQEKRE